MKKVTVYTTSYCPYCDAAKELLRNKKIDFNEVDVSDDDKKLDLKRRTGWRTVPQIFIGEEMIGGFQELRALDLAGELPKKLSS